MPQNSKVDMIEWMPEPCILRSQQLGPNSRNHFNTVPKNSRPETTEDDMPHSVPFKQKEYASHPFFHCNVYSAFVLAFSFTEVSMDDACIDACTGDNIDLNWWSTFAFVVTDEEYVRRIYHSVAIVAFFGIFSVRSIETFSSFRIQTGYNCWWARNRLFLFVKLNIIERVSGKREDGDLYLGLCSFNESTSRVLSWTKTKHPNFFLDTDTIGFWRLGRWL